MEHLIAAVRNYPCLWNTTAIEYRDQELKDAAWAEVMKETSLSSVKEVKLKWKKLRDSYRDALKRQSEMMAREPAAAARKNYPWKYMQHMTFLQPHMSARKKPEGPPPPAHDPDHADHADHADHNGHDHDEENGTGSSEESESEEEDTNNKSSQLTVIDRKLDYLCKASGKRRAGVWRRRASPPASPAAPAPDPIDIFFNSMCQATKRFPYPAQIKIKRVLFDAVLAAEEALLAEQQNYASLWARAASSSSDGDGDGAGAGEREPGGAGARREPS